MIFTFSLRDELISFESVSKILSHIYLTISIMGALIKPGSLCRLP